VSSVHVDGRFLDSARVGSNVPWSKAAVASILLHEMLHTFSYEHDPPDLPADLPEGSRYNYSRWPFNLTNYGDSDGCVHYPQ
jgi:hypothetical protein